MKITDKTEQNTVDPVVRRGDILKREHPLFGVEYYIVGNSPAAHEGDVLISLLDGHSYTQIHIPTNSTLQYYSNKVFAGGIDNTVTHIPAEKAELVIGG